MNASLSVTNTPFVTAFLYLFTDLSLEELGEIISSRLAGGASLCGREQYIRDEVPAIFVSNLLGGNLILQGEKGEYNLCLEPTCFPHNQLTESGQRLTELDISGVLAAQLEGIEGLTVELE